MQLILVRHGEADHNQTNIIAGLKACTGLTAVGVEQVGQLATRLRNSGELSQVKAFLSSPVPRAKQTAELLAGVWPDLPLEFTPALRELDPGQADGLTWEAYESHFGRFDLRAEPERPFAPGGDSRAGFDRRVLTTITGLAERFSGKTVVAVTHTGFIVATFQILFGIDPTRKAGVFIQPQYTSLTEWAFAGDRWELVKFNDAWHLTDHKTI